MEIILAGLVGLVSGVMLEGAVLPCVYFTLVGLVGGVIARTQPPGAEKIYWGFVLLIVVLAVLAYYGVSAHRYSFILPVVAVAGYFVARLVTKLRRLSSR